MFDLTNKTILLTGANGLLGSAYVDALEEAGADVIATDVDSLDVTNPDQWDPYADEPIDVLINNAAFTNNTPTKSYSASIFDYPLSDWNQMLQVNLTGTFLGCQKIASGMLARGRGSIINIGSLYGMGAPHFPIYEGTGVFQPPAYAVSKAAILGLTKYLACLWPTLRVNAISPGGVYNRQGDKFVKRFNQLVPMGRMATPEDICGAVVFLASDESRYMTGQNLVVDGGFSAW